MNQHAQAQARWLQMDSSHRCARIHTALNSTH